jgi:hypothetical protein
VDQAKVKAAEMVFALKDQVHRAEKEADKTVNKAENNMADSKRLV